MPAEFQQARPLVRALPINATTSAFTAKTAISNAKPTGNLVYPLCDTENRIVPSRMRIIPIGLGANDDAYSFRVWGWSRLGQAPDLGTCWIPILMGEYAVVLGAMAGLAGNPLLNTELLADTITVVSEPTTVAATTNRGETEVFSPANDTVAWIELRTRGVELLEFDFDQTTNTPSMNLLLQELTGPM